MYFFKTGAYLGDLIIERGMIINCLLDWGIYTKDNYNRTLRTCFHCFVFYLVFFFNVISTIGITIVDITNNLKIKILPKWKQSKNHLFRWFWRNQWPQEDWAVATNRRSTEKEIKIVLRCKKNAQPLWQEEYKLKHTVRKHFTHQIGNTNGILSSWDIHGGSSSYIHMEEALGGISWRKNKC